METKKIEIGGVSMPYILQNRSVENISIDQKYVRNEQKHRESCLKAKRKRKKKRK